MTGTIVALTATGALAQSPFSLKDCISYGLKNHPAVEVAGNNIENARQASREALAGYLPQVSLNGDLSNNLKLQTNIIPANPPLFPQETRLTFGNKYTSVLTAQVEQPIYNQSLITGLKANKPNQEIANLTAEQVKQNLIYNISSSYFQVITIYKQLELLNSNKTRTERLLEVAKLQAEAGVAKKVDVKQVQVSLNNVLAQISVVQNNLQLSYNTLKNAMGIFGNDSIILTDTARWLQAIPQITSVPEFNAANTVDYKLQEKQIQLYDINARSIRARALPSISAFGRYGMNGFGAEMSDVFSRQFDYSTIGLRFSWSVFDGFRRNAQYRQALYQRDNAQLNLEVNTANQNLQYLNAVSQFRQAQSTLATNKDNVNLATEVYDNVTLQYKEGVGSLSDLLNAESSYRDAQNNYILSLINYYLAQLDLERANSNLEQYYNKL
ncbi:MAG TPA: TolC family protein [Bacteroidia bacterium]|nr:TolC family protein [Bacteroidia bacterium]